MSEGKLRLKLIFTSGFSESKACEVSSDGRKAESQKIIRKRKQNTCNGGHYSTNLIGEKLNADVVRYVE
ncbi:hypothetical protein L2E82_14199 [Cichorium intybus]|uniref:Uncharacterized protein n=1 Tax=Cichorium intybus TaxID=13427 RepID=A0ACB9EZR6_CICIN|nr:hypothetical protein L2E82_14199 [Cichorium intybus]